MAIVIFNEYAKKYKINDEIIKDIENVFWVIIFILIIWLLPVIIIVLSHCCDRVPSLCNIFNMHNYDLQLQIFPYIEYYFRHFLGLGHKFPGTLVEGSHSRKMGEKVIFSRGGRASWRCWKSLLKKSDVRFFKAWWGYKNLWTYGIPKAKTGYGITPIPYQHSPPSFMYIYIYIYIYIDI